MDMQDARKQVGTLVTYHEVLNDRDFVGTVIDADMVYDDAGKSVYYCTVVWNDGVIAEFPFRYLGASIPILLDTAL